MQASKMGRRLRARQENQFGELRELLVQLRRGACNSLTSMGVKRAKAALPGFIMLQRSDTLDLEKAHTKNWMAR